MSFRGASRDRQVGAKQGGSLIVGPANNMLPRHKAEAFKERHNAVRGERPATVNNRPL
jgi:hypothetical protein